MGGAPPVPPSFELAGYWGRPRRGVAPPLRAAGLRDPAATRQRCRPSGCRAQRSSGSARWLRSVPIGLTARWPYKASGASRPSVRNQPCHGLRSDPVPEASRRCPPEVGRVLPAYRLTGRSPKGTESSAHESRRDLRSPKRRLVVMIDQRVIARHGEGNSILMPSKRSLLTDVIESEWRLLARARDSRPAEQSATLNGARNDRLIVRPCQCMSDR